MPLPTASPELAALAHDPRVRATMWAIAGRIVRAALLPPVALILIWNAAIVPATGLGILNGLGQLAVIVVFVTVFAIRNARNPVALLGADPGLFGDMNALFDSVFVAPPAVVDVTPAAPAATKATMTAAPSAALRVLAGVPVCAACRASEVVLEEPSGSAVILRNGATLAIWAARPDGDGLLILTPLGPVPASEAGAHLEASVCDLMAQPRDWPEAARFGVRCPSCAAGWSDIVAFAADWRAAETPGRAKKLVR